MNHPLITGALSLAALSLSLFASQLDLELDELEATHLTFMRSEELLARDVYLTLQEKYPDLEVFSNIGEGSEQTHTDAVRDALDAYELEDPNPDANNFKKRPLGTFVRDDDPDYGGEYGWYFQEKYDELVAWGSQGLEDALLAGAFIEELDMLDIIECPKVILEYEEAIDPDNPVCGLNYTDDPRLQNLYSHLADGSENHLRAFVKNLENLTGEPYKAQVLPPDVVDAILGR
jgi:hypothetical protein